MSSSQNGYLICRKTIKLANYWRASFLLYPGISLLERDLCRHSSFADIDMNVMKISATGGKDRQHSIHHITNNAPVNPKASADWRHLCLRWRNKYCKLAIWQIACASFDTIIQSSSSSPRGSSGNVTHFVGTATITTCTSEPIWQGSGHVASLSVTTMRHVRVIY